MNPAAADFAGYVVGALMPDGQVRAVEASVSGGGRLVAAPNMSAWKGGRSDIWSYRRLEEALAALTEWKADEKEPDGWIRHQPSNRRRHYEGSGVYEWMEP